MPFSFMRSPSPLEKMESKILKEGKIEDTTVKHELKDLATLEKESHKARKALEKAQHTLAKREKEEHSATAALNKATHSHEVAVVKLDDAAKDLKLRQERETKLHADLAEKRAELDKVVAIQKAHNEDREARISEIREEREQKSGSLRSAASPIVSSPATSSIAPPVSTVEPQTSGSASDAPPVAKADTESITSPTVASSTVVGASSTAA